MAKNGIEALTEDHERIRRHFEKFEAAGDRAVKTKADIVERIVHDLSVHAAIEESVFYPIIRELDDSELQAQMLEGLEEHHVAKVLLSEIDGMDPEDERFDAKVMVLIESVRHHLDEEEQDLFPAVRRHLDREELDELGDAVRRGRDVAPTRPHPGAPDEPPGTVVNLAAGLIDRVRDRVRSVKA